MFLNTNYYNCYFVRDAEVAGSNPVASTPKKARKINVSGLSLSSPWPLKILRSKQNSKQIVPNLYRPLSFPSSQINLFPHYGYPAGIMYPLATLNRDRPDATVTGSVSMNFLPVGPFFHLPSHTIPHTIASLSQGLHGQAILPVPILLFPAGTGLRHSYVGDYVS